jgi:hypothetical protein
VLQQPQPSSLGANTGNGIIGATSNVNFNGASTTVDKVVLYNTTPPGTRQRERQQRACSNVTTIGPKLDLSSAANMAFTRRKIAACEAAAVVACS